VAASGRLRRALAPLPVRRDVDRHFERRQRFQTADQVRANKQSRRGSKKCVFQALPQSRV
jgi:hypothetical protein